MGSYLLLVEVSDGRAESSGPVVELGRALILTVEVQPIMSIAREDLDHVGSVGWAWQGNMSISKTVVK